MLSEGIYRLIQKWNVKSEKKRIYAKGWIRRGQRRFSLVSVFFYILLILINSCTILFRSGVDLIRHKKTNHNKEKGSTLSEMQVYKNDDY